jgi:ABC-2 type transport system permease protein
MARFWSMFVKCAREQKRDLWVLSLSLAFAPLFVFIYWLMTSAGGSTTYNVLVINHDAGIETPGGQILNSGTELISLMRAFSYENGSPLLKLIESTDRQNAEERLRGREAALLLLIPADFSVVLRGNDPDKKTLTTKLEFVGDLTNPAYTLAAVTAMTVADEYMLKMSGETRPVKIVETALGASSARTEFENYIPGIFIFAVIMMVFQASMLVARESEGGKIIRLRLAGISSFEMLGGMSAWLVVVSTLSVVLTYLTALVFGFHSQGPVLLALLISIITSVSIIGIGMIVASFARSVTQAFVIANFPLGFLMFLTGSIFPLPRANLFTLFGHPFALNDLLPPTHAVIALNKIFTLGADLSDVWFELTMLTILTILYFSVGVVLFKRLNLKLF